MSRIILSVKEIHSFAGKGMIEEAFKIRLNEDNNYRHMLAKKYAMKEKLHNGATLEFPADGYRNHNLLFWDAHNEEIVEPFTEIDDYGSVPPRFVVGHGYFNPFDWIDEVDHNSYIFPAKSLIDEMKEFAEKYPNEKKMIVTINGHDYTVCYKPSEMKDKWDTCILEVIDMNLQVFPGNPKWRETIVDDIEEPVYVHTPVAVHASVPVAAPVAAPVPVAVPVAAPVSQIEKLQKSNAVLTTMLEELTETVKSLTTMVEKLTMRIV